MEDETMPTRHACPECRRGRLLPFGNEDYPDAVRCENCDRWWATLPPERAATFIPGSYWWRVEQADQPCEWCGAGDPLSGDHGRGRCVSMASQRGGFPDAR